MDVAAERKTKKSDSVTAFAGFDMPKFEFPKMEIPEAFREFIEKGAFQAKEAYEKMKTATEEATNLLESTYATAAKGSANYNLKVIELAKLNANATFNYVQSLFGVTDFSTLIKLSTDHAHEQMATLTEQTKVLTSLAQQTAAQVTEPIKTEITKVFSKTA